MSDSFETRSIEKRLGAHLSEWAESIEVKDDPGSPVGDFHRNSFWLAHAFLPVAATIAAVVLVGVVVFVASDLDVVTEPPPAPFETDSEETVPTTETSQPESTQAETTVTTPPTTAVLQTPPEAREIEPEMTAVDGYAIGISPDNQSVVTLVPDPDAESICDPTNWERVELSTGDVTAYDFDVGNANTVIVAGNRVAALDRCEGPISRLRVGDISDTGDIRNLADVDLPVDALFGGVDYASGSLYLIGDNQILRVSLVDGTVEVEADNPAGNTLAFNAQFAYFNGSLIEKPPFVTDSLTAVSSDGTENVIDVGCPVSSIDAQGQVLGIAAECGAFLVDTNFELHVIDGDTAATDIALTVSDGSVGVLFGGESTWKFYKDGQTVQWSTDPNYSPMLSADGSRFILTDGQTSLVGVTPETTGPTTTTAEPTTTTTEPSTTTMPGPTTAPDTTETDTTTPATSTPDIGGLREIETHEGPLPDIRTFITNEEYLEFPEWQISVAIGERTGQNPGSGIAFSCTVGGNPSVIDPVDERLVMGTLDTLDRESIEIAIGAYEADTGCIPVPLPAPDTCMGLPSDPAACTEDLGPG